MRSAWDDDAPLHDWEYPEEKDDDDTAVVPCPQCGADVYEDAPQCPECGEYLIHGIRTGTAWQGRAGWWIALGLAGIIAVIVLLLNL